MNKFTEKHPVISSALIMAALVLAIAIGVELIKCIFPMHYEYETLDGEIGTAKICFNMDHREAYCRLEDNTEVFGIKSWKRIWE